SGCGVPPVRAGRRSTRSRCSRPRLSPRLRPRLTCSERTSLAPRRPRRRPAAAVAARAGLPESEVSPPQRTLRRPLVRPLQPALSREQRLTAALDAADKGARDDALAGVASLLADDPLDADAHFVRGLVTPAAGGAGAGWGGGRP